MRRRLTASGLFALAIALVAAAQEPVYRERTVVSSDYPFPLQFVRAQPDPKAKAPDDKKGEPKPAPKADPADAAVAAALARDPDVLAARAKIQLAEAELAKARQVITLKVVTLRGKRDQLRAEVRSAEIRVANVVKLMQSKVVSPQEVDLERDRLAVTAAGLAVVETELKLLTGGTDPGTTGAAADPNHNRSVEFGLKWLAEHQGFQADASASLMAYMLANELKRGRGAAGPIPDRVRAVLDKPLKLGARGETVTFEKALEAFRKVGLDVPVRGSLPLVDAPDPKNPNEFKAQPVAIVSEGEELPVGAWFQLFEDNAVAAGRNGGRPARYRFYVREYGLLVSATDAAPPDAPPLVDFWKQKPPPAKDVKEEPKPKW
jgi:hypothetical protein